MRQVKAHAVAALCNFCRCSRATMSALLNLILESYKSTMKVLGTEWSNEPGFGELLHSDQLKVIQKTLFTNIIQCDFFCHSQPSYSPSVSDGLMSAKDSGNIEDESIKQVPASQSTAGPDRREHRRFSSSAFASSLSWDSDSEKEALDGNRRPLFQ